MKTNLFIFVIALVMVVISCQSDVEFKQSYYNEEDQKILSQYLNLPDEPFDYTIDYPDYVRTNVRTNFNYDLATLGRVMFYDKNLSSDNTISCASCHKQELAFSDDVAKSAGVESRVTKRNSISLGSVINFNLYYGTHVFGAIPFFWDNSANTIQEQSERTFGNKLEMNITMDEVTKKMHELPYYRPLIKKAFAGKTQVSKDEALDAMAEFVNSITNYDTKFDKALDAHFKTYRNTEIEKVDLAGYTPIENKGKEIYLTACATCHGSVAGRPGRVAENNGLYLSYTDSGAGSSLSNAKFKVPTLRNILRSAPYMHDGSLATIDDVLEHYSTGIKMNSGLSGDLRSGNQAKKFNFTEQEKDALKAFFATMNDESVVSAEKFSDPFTK